MPYPTPLIDSAVIIGGGIFGVSTAAQLTRMGVAVTLINDGPLANGASGRSLAWLNTARRRSLPYHRLRQAGMERYRVLSDTYSDADWLCFGGGLTWDLEGPKNEIPEVYRYERNLGYEAHLLSGEEVTHKVPGVNGAAVTKTGAILNPNEGWVDLPALIAILAEEINSAGGKIITDAGKATPVVTEGRATGARCDDGRDFGGDVVLLATGPAVPAMAATHGIKIGDGTPIAVLVETQPVDHPLRAVLNTPFVAVRRTINGAFYLDSDWPEEEVTQRADGGYDLPDWVAEKLIDEARKVLNPAPDLSVIDVHFGPKPIPSDGDPVFGELAELPGCFVAFSHSGATLGLITGELLAEEMALGIRHSMLKPFRPERFAD
ncbi:NAD(P)/FAD-dependent oxidoreductase [Celeribacter halophilus]|uniref:NAD(P)/FAD-dependent oxidoreductase n=1 Tax=Celeribacter halophilus TaxID=576117 RepID=UPI001C08F3CD|nr:FAD-binding oxidoreductase [Celeribacter halophilus]MBU2889085.1 FAD-binding oxidoreductase [Celeribacter halophilus]MDO6510386.1 FAD-binding oxidoreductase [Celeribacter halophilus]